MPVDETEGNTQPGGRLQSQPFVSWAGPLKGSLAFAVANVLLFTAIVAILYRRGIFLRAWDMDKPAPTTYPINELLQDRWSPMAFADTPVSDGMLFRLFEAARWAPSSFNEQPWGFIVATKQDEEAHKAIADVIAEGNRQWAERAPVLMMSLAKLTLSRNDKPNRHAYHDLGMAVATMLVQATDMELVAHQMGGFDIDKARTTLEIPSDWDPVAAIALGHPGNAEDLPAELQKREYAPRTRNDFKEFVWSGSFGNPMPFSSRVRRALEGN